MRCLYEGAERRLEDYIVCFSLGNWGHERERESNVSLQNLRSDLTRGGTHRRSVDRANFKSFITRQPTHTHAHTHIRVYFFSFTPCRRAKRERRYSCDENLMMNGYLHSTNAPRSIKIIIIINNFFARSIKNSLFLTSSRKQKILFIRR